MIREEKNAAAWNDWYVNRYRVPCPPEAAWPKLKPSRDIQPVTEFRANAAQFIQQVQATGEPVILTQHGRSAAVLLDVASIRGRHGQARAVKVIWSPRAERRTLEAVNFIAQARPLATAAWDPGEVPDGVQRRLVPIAVRAEAAAGPPLHT